MSRLRSLICFAGMILILSSSFAANRITFPTANNSITIFSEPFSGGMSNWTSIDNSSSGIKWKYTSTGIYRQGSYPGYDTLSSAGTTASNGYVIFDSDSSQNNVGPEDGDLISPAISCLNFSKVRLSFNQLLIHKFETATVSVSTDGSNFSVVYEPSASLITNQATSNPDYVDIDISSVAANEPVVYLKFNFSGSNDFFWMIDDVRIYFPETDAAIGLVNPVSSCSPLSSSENIEISLFNTGDEAISDFTVTYLLDQGNTISEVYSDTIFPGENKPYTFTTPADISSLGEHQLLVYLELSADTNYLNDTVRSTFFTGPHPVDPMNNYFNGFESAEEISGIGVEDANNDGTSCNLSSQLPHSGMYAASFNGSTADDWIYTTCLDLQPTYDYKLSYSFAGSIGPASLLEVKLGQSQEQLQMNTLLKSTMIQNSVYLNDSVPFNVATGGTYYIGFHIFNPDSTTFLLDDILVQANVASGFLRPETAVYSIFPNPGNGLFTISSVNSGENKKVMVKNSVGQLIFTKSISTSHQENVDLRFCEAGLYILEIQDENGKREFISKLMIQ